MPEISTINPHGETSVELGQPYDLGQHLQRDGSIDTTFVSSSGLLESVETAQQQPPARRTDGVPRKASRNC